MRGRIITTENIYAALSAYLLAGVVFGVIHWTVESVLPGSYGEAGVGGAPAKFSLTTALYYSFVTLATLGYGDLVPKTEVLNTSGKGAQLDRADRGARRR